MTNWVGAIVGVLFVLSCVKNVGGRDIKWADLPTNRGAQLGENSLLTRARYTPTPCSFDLDDDGIPGEPEDCKICNGIDSDPDGDGMDENMIYVDCDNGEDAIDCGNVTHPCKTIGYSWTTVAALPTTNQEDIICFKGTCTTEVNISPGVNGVDGFRTKTRSGSEEWDWQYPTNPTMLVGWDADGDGEYPPYDTDDIAVVDGRPNKLARFMHLGWDKLKVPSFVEMAHFSVTGYGSYTTEVDTGFMHMGKVGAEVSTHVYVHDVHVYDVNREKAEGRSQSSTLIFNWFSSVAHKYYLFSNMKITEFSSWMSRGGFGQDTVPDMATGQDEHIRYQNLFVRPRGKNTEHAGMVAVKEWGFKNFVEWIDNVWDANVPPHGPFKPEANGRLTGVLINMCMQNVVVRNNFFYNWATSIRLQAAVTGFCTARHLTDVYVDHNIIHHDSNYWGFGALGIVSKDDGGGVTPFSGSIKDVYIRDNIIRIEKSNDTAIQAGIWVHTGNKDQPQVGTIYIERNTIRGFKTRNQWGAITIGHPDDKGEIKHRLQNFVIRDNDIRGFDGAKGFDNLVYRFVDEIPSNLIADNNTYPSCGEYRVVDTRYDDYAGFKTEWRTNDASSTFCRASTACEGNATICSMDELPYVYQVPGSLGKGLDVPDFDRNSPGSPGSSPGGSNSLARTTGFNFQQVVLLFVCVLYFAFD